MEFLIIFILYIILFLISIKIKDNSIVDIFWGTGFVILAFYMYIFKTDFDLYKTIVLLIVSFWGIRLSYYILKRKLVIKKEDPRYAEWRSNWKYFYFRSFFQIYILQMLIMFVIAFPLYYIFSSKDLNIYFLIIGITISIIGLFIEIVSDYQVQNYLKNKHEENKVFTGGLFKYSRNPNYFGESMFWLGISVIGAGVNIFSFIGFFTITFLLLFVSGVPLKEKRQEKKDNWNEYKEKTSKFIPWFPKN